MVDAMKLAATEVAATPFEIPGAQGQFRIQILNEDAGRGVVTSIVHIPAGGVIPAHFHEAGPEMHYVLSGDLIERGETLGAGAFLTHAPGVVHGPHESRDGAQVLTVQQWQSRDGAFDFHPAEGEAAAGGGAPVPDRQAGAPQAEGQPTESQPAARPARDEPSAAGQGGDAPPTGAGDPTKDRQATEESLGRGYG